MFAIMILGIGFIMVAGMFPVAIQQAQVTQEESAAALVAQFGSQFLQGTTVDGDYPFATSGALLAPLPINLKTTVAVLPTRPWDKVAGKMIFATDSRYAWVPLYRRRPNANSAEVVIFVLQSRTTDNFNPGAALPPADDTYPALYPRKVSITTRFGGADATGTRLGPDTIQIQDSSGSAPAFADTGAFVVTGVSNSSTDQPVRIYRLGSRVDGTTDTWEMAPGYGMSTVNTSTQSNNEAVTQQDAWMLGRQGQWSGGSGSANFVPDNIDAPVMDVGCFATFISL
ncbi:MAG: hypothetical protein ACHRHE_08200 [Tepidisphaerales bacterium]